MKAQHVIDRSPACPLRKPVPPARTAAVAAALLALFAAGCSTTGTRTDARQIDLSPIAPLPHTPADVHFMSGMIPHHAQAVLIGGWAATRSSRSDIRILAERIVVGQRDEIALMQSWLRARNQPVPAADATHLRMTMNGMEHDMIMPGMLAADELAQLERARGTEFDRLFLTYMIRHHEGAITMVDQLFASPGAAQDDIVFRFASDVYADQTTEVDRMLTMLEDLAADGRTH